MHAWRFQSGKDLTWQAVQDPKAGPGEVVIEVAAAGMCHTDVSHIESGGAHLPQQPFTLGHEVAGRICEVGPDVREWHVGDRVAVLASTSGPGSARDGGYAERVLALVDELVAIPPNVSDIDAAVATDAGVTAYRAVLTKGEVESGTRVGIIGLGGLGILGARIAVVTGAEVFAADPRTAPHKIALEQGITECSTSIVDFSDRDLDVVIDFAGMDTTRDAIKAVRPGGRVVQVGIGKFEATLDLFDVLIKQPEYTGTATGTIDDLNGVLDMVAGGYLHPVIEEIGFGEIPAGLKRLAAGEVTGRLVATR
ncbi:alcohol dehydrogenase catalytic domain-containing protein [Rhodococcus sp. T2V]|uniref:alcohol dehydrogenase catalytic domain-containing protein n=1 Tax=Rhodococcus sp. T2V TaxID=3034164 RepID=UPI0023E17F0A|nr:alcohol dehydrogenase catalytic domain-containing protein [Rhodococcus sp. T2V]MDF3309706.1 alcohol dehydrogenase catalytic domain-containing protein [Rhodococcus sp. T2V]